MTDEWLYFIADCRKGHIHDIDVISEENNVIDVLCSVFESFISGEISDFNSSVYYISPEYLKYSYLEGKLLA